MKLFLASKGFGMSSKFTTKVTVGKWEVQCLLERTETSNCYIATVQLRSYQIDWDTTKT